MRFGISSALIFTLAAYSAPALAKDVGTYNVRISVNNQLGGKWNDVLTAFSGWTCVSSTEAKFAERLRDNHGQEKIIPRKMNANWNFFTTADVDLKFDRDLDAAEPQIGVTVTENCSKTTYKTERKCKSVDDYDDKGNRTGSHQDCQDETVSDTKSAYMNWDCSMPVTANEVGQSQHTECRPGSSNFASFDFEAWALTALRDKKFSADLNMLSHEEKFAQDFCAPGENRNKVVVRLTQGVGGNWMQHHFIFNFNVAGHSFTMDNAERGNGILNDDLAICDAGATIPITVTAIAKNAIFPNSHYTPDQPQQASMDLKRNSDSGTIYLRRHAFLGNWTTNPDNWVAASVRDVSVAPPPPPASLAATTAINGLQDVNGNQGPAGVTAADDHRGVKTVHPAPHHQTGHKPTGAKSVN